MEKAGLSESEGFTCSKEDKNSARNSKASSTTSETSSGSDSAESSTTESEPTVQSSTSDEPMEAGEDPAIHSEQDLETHRQKAWEKYESSKDPENGKTVSRRRLTQAVNIFFHILQYSTKTFGETHPNCGLAYYDYANTFFQLLQVRLDGGCRDEEEDFSLREDWDVVTECVFRAVSAAERDRNMSLRSQALCLLCSCYIEREDYTRARDIVEQLSRECYNTNVSLLLAQAYTLCGQYASAAGEITKLAQHQEGLTRDQKEKLQDLIELSQNDPIKLKWEINAIVKSMPRMEMRKNVHTGNVITTFPTIPAHSGKQDTQTSTKTLNIVFARSKRVAESTLSP